jgi:hypothetical protein
MANTLKILGQINPSATTITSIYTVPALTSATVSTVAICNQSASAGTFRLAVLKSGDGLAAKHYLYYDVTLSGNDTFAATLGITLAAGDALQVYTSSATMSAHAYGIEVS